MPIPTPRMGKNPEKQSKFMSRCMSDKITKKEFPDNKQRVAVCFSSWRKKHGGKPPTKEELIGYIVQETICALKELYEVKNAK